MDIPDRKKHRDGFKLSHLLCPIFIFSSVCSGAAEAGPGRLPVNSSMQENSSATAGEITLQADEDGHFRGTLLINNVSMPFLIDTGATVTTVPMKLAVAARLPLGRQIETHTAAGKSYDKSTKIDSLKIGTAEIGSIEANVNQHLTEVLIGMNTLKYFKMYQTANKLTLLINTHMQDQGKLENGVTIGKVSQADQDIAVQKTDYKPANPIKKSVICDEHKHCITRFDNQ